MPAIGERGKSAMKRKTEYANEDIRLGKTVVDFLPSPVELAEREETAKITINLHRGSVAFFKEEAKRTGTPYQKLIRKVVELYADHHRS